jgi:hypothetical protein
MAKDASLFTWLDKDRESKIYVVDDFSLDVVGQGDFSYRCGNIVDLYHMPNLNSNMLYVSQLTQIGNIAKFWPDRFYVHDLKGS